MKNNNWCVYILACSDNSLYTGITNDLFKRCKKHFSGKGSKYVRSRLPAKLVWFDGCKNKKIAGQKEYAIKQLPRAEKLKLIAKLWKYEGENITDHLTNHFVDGNIIITFEI